MARGVTGQLRFSSSAELFRRLESVGPVNTPNGAYSLPKLQVIGMLGNDVLGDCTAAGAGHICDIHALKIDSNYVATTSEALSFYERFGYEPGNPSTDQGASLVECLESWETQGFPGFAPKPVQAVTCSVEQAAHELMSFNCPIYCAVQLPESAEQQFDAGETWTVVPSAIAGGHCIVMTGFTTVGPMFITWGRYQNATWDWWYRYGVEAHAIRDWSDTSMDTSRPFGTIAEKLEELDGRLKKLERRLEEV